MNDSRIIPEGFMSSSALSRSRSRRGRKSRDEVPIHRRLGERASAMDGRFAADLGGGRP